MRQLIDFSLIFLVWAQTFRTGKQILNLCWQKKHPKMLEGNREANGCRVCRYREKNLWRGGGISERQAAKVAFVRKSSGNIRCIQSSFNLHAVNGQKGKLLRLLWKKKQITRVLAKRSKDLLPGWYMQIIIRSVYYLLMSTKNKWKNLIWKIVVRAKKFGTRGGERGWGNEVLLHDTNLVPKMTPIYSQL